MKNVIEQIRKIKGVKTVEATGEGMAVVVFEGKLKNIAVKCETEQQFEFVKLKTNNDILKPFDQWHGFPCVEIDGGCTGAKSPYMMELNVILFMAYILDNGLLREWESFTLKPKSLSPDELVDGKIYVDEDEIYPNIFRFKKQKYGQCSSYSRLFTNDGTFYLNEDLILPKGIHSATPSEAQTLIRAEVANDFFFELK